MLKYIKLCSFHILDPQLPVLRKIISSLRQQRNQSHFYIHLELMVVVALNGKGSTRTATVVLEIGMSNRLSDSCWNIVSGSSFAFVHSILASWKGENSTPASSVGEQISEHMQQQLLNVCSARHRLQGWAGMAAPQLPAPTLHSNGPVYWHWSRPLHSPTLLKLGLSGFPSKTLSLGTCPALPSLVNIY